MMLVIKRAPNFWSSSTKAKLSISLDVLKPWTVHWRTIISGNAYPFRCKSSHLKYFSTQELLQLICDKIHQTPRKSRAALKKPLLNIMTKVIFISTILNKCYFQLFKSSTLGAKFISEFVVSKMDLRRVEVISIAERVIQSIPLDEIFVSFRFFSQILKIGLSAGWHGRNVGPTWQACCSSYCRKIFEIFKINYTNLADKCRNRRASRKSQEYRKLHAQRLFGLTRWDE